MSPALLIATPLSESRALLVTGSDALPVSSIAALTRRLVRAEETAFREFHALYFDRLYRFLLGVTRGEVHAAQDALQETLLRDVRHAREFQSEEIFWGWLKAVARNAARDARRKHRRYLALLDTFSLRPDSAANSVLSRDDEAWRGLLEESLAQLEVADRHLLEEKYLRGATVLEMAASAGLTEKTIESRLARLRRQLARLVLRKLRHP